MTIFDFNPTKEEIKTFALNMSESEYKSKYSKRDQLADLLYFLADRNDPRVKDILPLVDDETRNDYNRLILHT